MGDVEKIIEKAKNLENFRDEILLKKIDYGRIVLQKVKNPKTNSEFFRIHVFVAGKLKPVILLRDSIDISVIFEVSKWLNKHKKDIIKILETLNSHVSKIEEKKEEEELLS